MPEVILLVDKFEDCRRQDLLQVGWDIELRDVHKCGPGIARNTATNPPSLLSFALPLITVLAFILYLLQVAELQSDLLKSRLGLE